MTRRNRGRRRFWVRPLLQIHGTCICPVLFRTLWLKSSSAEGFVAPATDRQGQGQRPVSHSLFQCWWAWSKKSSICCNINNFGSVFFVFCIVYCNERRLKINIIVHHIGLFYLINRDMSQIMTKPTKWLCAQRRLRSAWASAQSDQSLRCPHEESLGP